MTSKENKELQVEINPIDKRILKQVWTKMRAGEQLEGAGVYIGRSMAEHPQWFALFEALGVLEGEDELPDGTNPYIHLTLHILVGGQIFHSEPKQATRFYQRRIERGDDSHLVAHMMIEVFKRHLIWTAKQGRDASDFDNKAYGKTLHTLTGLTTSEIWQRLGQAKVPTPHTT